MPAWLASRCGMRASTRTTFILWRSIMASDSMRPAHRSSSSAVAFVSIEARAALLLLATAVAPTALAQDERPATPEHVVGQQAYPFDTVDPRGGEHPPTELPDSGAPKLALLTREQIEFLKSGAARAFPGPAEKTVEALEKRTPEEVKAWVEAMQEGR